MAEAPQRRLRSRAARALLLAASIVFGASAAAAQDAGFGFDLDLERYELSVVDLVSGERWDTVRVVAGSPAAPTPRGSFRMGFVVLRPRWVPGELAAAAGAHAEAASVDGPMGVAKLPFARNGSVALHGGGNALLLGFPVSSGCVRARDADLLRLLAWLDLQGGLGPPLALPGGEVRREFVRPALIEVH